MDSVKTREKTAVVLLGFGGPESEAEVRPFVEHVAQGRSISKERLDQVVEQYKLIGGKSPFNALTHRQADALQKELQKSGLDLSVHLGFLHTRPFIEDTIADLIGAGYDRLIACIMAPQRTEASFDRYVRAANQGRLQSNKQNIEIAFLPDWHTEPKFIEAAAQRVQNEFRKLPPCQKDQTLLIFTAHSVPQAMSDQSGYERQIKETGNLIAQALNHKDWQVAYQSRSGNPNDPWLGPDILLALEEAKKNKIENIVVMPIGFVCDHVEVLYDLDLQAKSRADQLGLNFFRAKTVQDHESFISLLAHLVESELLKVNAKQK